MLFDHCDLVLNFSKIAIVCIYRMQEDTFVPNLVETDREMVEKSK